MISQKLKRVWGSVPLNLKRVVGFAAGVAGFLLELTANDDENEPSGDAFAEMYLDEKGNVTHEPTSTEYDPWGTRS
ncbi:MAG: hypothetical protein RPU91_03985 [Candidatus Sedimenticola sp. (ex Thyasira tokunagai)]